MAKERSEWNLGALIVPGLGALLALYYIYTIKGLPWLAQMYGGALSVVCLIFFIAVVVLVRSHRVQEGEKISDKSDKSFFAQYGKFLFMVFLTSLFIFILPYVGYVAAATLLGVSIAGYLGYSRNPLALLKVGLGIALMGFILFVLFLDVDLSLDSVSSSIGEAVRSWWR